MIVLALVLGGKDRSTPTAPAVLPALTPTAPAPNAAVLGPCTKVLEALPEQLGTLLPRVVHPKPYSAFVVAWGDPAVILRCGVDRPADLKPGSTVDNILIGGSDGRTGVYFDVTSVEHNEVYTSVDRAVYISITVPSKYASPPVPTLAVAIAKALPAVCVGGQEPGLTDESKLCTRRP
ncbi:MAG: DUF3515 domain-containing protein [Jatrophihabitantaceae bacterium]